MSRRVGFSVIESAIAKMCSAGLSSDEYLVLPACTCLVYGLPSILVLGVGTSITWRFSKESSRLQGSLLIHIPSLLLLMMMIMIIIIIMISMLMIMPLFEKGWLLVWLTGFAILTVLLGGAKVELWDYQVYLALLDSSSSSGFPTTTTTSS
jgi:hypothetical protein